jgi:hypothetical protein
MTATLREYAVPVDGRGRVWADLTRPDGTMNLVPLAETEPGRFEGGYTATVNGLYTMRMRAAGETFYGSRFTREQTLTVVVRPGGNRPPEGIADPWCQWINCLRDSGAFGPEFVARLKKWGLDVTALIQCLRDRCRRPEMTEIPSDKPDAVTPLDGNVLLNDLKELIERWRAR